MLAGCEKPRSDSPFRTTVFGESAAYVAKWVSDHVRPRFFRNLPEWKLPIEQRCLTEMLSWAEGTLQDILLAIRGMRRNPAYALTGIIAAALGIGASTAV